MEYGVVIPAYNASRTIGEALSSVLQQTAAPTSVLVVDDGSTDDTAEIAVSFGPQITVIKQANSGPGRATSRGIEQISQDLVATLDADDIWVPEKMDKQIAALAQNPKLSLVFSMQRQFRHGHSDRVSGEVREGTVRSSMVFKRCVFEAVGEIIDPPGGRGDLIDWLARVREAGFKSELLDEVLCLRRIISGSLSHGRDLEKDRGYLEVAYRAMQRRKAAQKDRP